MSQKKSKKYLKRHQKPSPWPLVALLAGGVLLVIGAIVASNRAPAQPETPPAVEVSGAPSLTVDQEEVNLGDVKLGQTVSVSFQLTNVGDQPLRFSEAPYIELKAGC